MKKLLSLALVSALALAACGGGGRTAITINGEVTTVSDIEAMFVRGDNPVTKERFANDLNFYVQWRLLPDAVKERWGLEFTEEEIEAEAASIVADFSQPGETRAEFLETRGLTELYLQRASHLGLIDAAVGENLKEDIERVAPELDEEEMDQARGELANVCSSHILATNLQGVPAEDLDEAKEEAKAEAQDLIDQIKAGADFEELAREHGSDGTATEGGDLGCTTDVRRAFVGPFAEAILTAPVGEVLDEPVESQFGFHVILVRERSTDEEVIEAYIDRTVQTLMQVEFQVWLNDVLRAAEVEVNPRFGTWETEPRAMVVAPAE